MEDRDLLALEGLGDVGRRDFTLLVVAPAGAERVPEALLGELHVGGSRGDLKHPVLVVDGRGRDRDAGVEVADHVFHAVADELVGDRDALLGIGNVVAGLERDLVAEDAALRVEVIDGLLGALLELGAEGGVGAGDRPGDAELEVRRVGGGRSAGEGEARRQHETRQSGRSESLHVCYLPALGSGRAGRRGRGGFDANVPPSPARTCGKQGRFRSGLPRMSAIFVPMADPRRGRPGIAVLLGVTQHRPCPMRATR